MDALASSPLPSPLSDLMRDRVLPQEEGGGRPGASSPSSSPSSLCQVPGEAHGLTVPKQSATRSRRKRSGSQNRTMKRKAAESLKDALAFPTEAPGGPRRIAARES
jgi:hypothetical protein